jgi:hypothetical protein
MPTFCQIPGQLDVSMLSDARSRDGYQLTESAAVSLAGSLVLPKPHFQIGAAHFGPHKSESR